MGGDPEPQAAVPAELRNALVHGADGRRPLGDFLRGPTLLVFLRHFG